MKISAYASADLGALIGRVARLEPEIRKNIRNQSKRTIIPAWKAELEKNASTTAERRLLANTGKATVTDRNVILRAANAGRGLSGGATPAGDWHAFEFGALHSKVRYQTRSRNGKVYEVTRRTRRQLRRRNKSGYVIFKAISNVVPRAASLWYQTAARTIHETFEG